jgi:epoxyqueuosine reductase
MVILPDNRIFMIKQIALSLGFDACGIAKADELKEDAIFMGSWLADGNHGEMSYLTRNFEKRTDPRKLVPGCKSIVVVLLNYFPNEKQIADAPQIAKYAYSEIDYHTVIKTKLNELENQICIAYGTESVCPDYQHLFVDSAPVLERRWAERAGLGWIGKHTQLIHPGLGSYCFIGVLMLNIEVEYDFPLIARCGNCTRCMDACPTKALNNGSIDARRCISYLTIENKNETPEEFQPQLSNKALGCDICADVCPWNKKWAKSHCHSELLPKKEYIELNSNSIEKTSTMLQWDSEMWQQLTKKKFKLIFGKSAIQRTGYSKLMKNIEVINKK